MCGAQISTEHRTNDIQCNDCCGCLCGRTARLALALAALYKLRCTVVASKITCVVRPAPATEPCRADRRHQAAKHTPRSALKACLRRRTSTRVLMGQRGRARILYSSRPLISNRPPTDKTCPSRRQLLDLAYRSATVCVPDSFLFCTELARAPSRKSSLKKICACSFTGQVVGNLGADDEWLELWDRGMHL